jgi:hypothetical protein
LRRRRGRAPWQHVAQSVGLGGVGHGERGVVQLGGARLVQGGGVLVQRDRVSLPVYGPLEPLRGPLPRAPAMLRVIHGLGHHASARP